MATAAPTMTTGLYQVSQRVDDLDRAIAFYRDLLDLPLIGKWDPPGLALFDIFGTRLMLSGEEDGTSAILYFQVDDLSAAVERLRGAGVTVEHEPHVVFHDTEGKVHVAGTEEWMAFVRDSEGNLLALVATVLP